MFLHLPVHVPGGRVRAPLHLPPLQRGGFCRRGGVQPRHVALRRLAQHEAMLSQQRDQRESLGAASDATHQLLQQARAENERLQERLDKSEETRRSEGAANARWVLELQGQLLRVASQRKGSVPTAEIRAYGGI